MRARFRRQGKLTLWKMLRNGKKMSALSRRNHGVRVLVQARPMDHSRDVEGQEAKLDQCICRGWNRCRGGNALPCRVGPCRAWLRSIVRTWSWGSSRRMVGFQS